MSPTRATDAASRKNYPKGQDKNRHAEDHEHHPVAVPEIHPPHHAQKKAELPPRHHPHTGPENKDLNIDHGIHEDRPRPGKIAKKEETHSSNKMPK
ncbi:MAG: hypothetical protein WCE65_01365 [Methanoregula sp.]